MAMNSPLMSWKGVETEINRIGFKSGDTDNILAPLLHGRRKYPEEIQAIFLLLGWAPLRACWKKLTSLDPNADERWSNLVWSFLSAVHRLDLAQRHHHFGRKIINDTTHDVRAWYRRERERFPGLPVDEDKPDPYEMIPSHYREHQLVEEKTDRDWAVARLEALAESGKISRVDCHILLGSCVYGHSLNEMADRLGVSYAVVKKRRQRALKKVQKNAPSLSPDNPDSPLYLVERSPRKEA